MVIARLVLLSGERGVLYLRPGRHVIGRGHNCDLVLGDRGVSRQHVVIELDETSAVVTDQASRNGTKVDGRPVDRCTLRHGSVVQMGSAVCRFEWVERGATVEDEPTPQFDESMALREPVVTAAEQRVLTLLLGGLAEKAIAATLHISRHTVHNHVKKIYAVYGVSSRSELLARFIARPDAVGPEPTQ